MKKFCIKYGYTLNTPNLEEIYFQTMGKRIEELYNYEILIDPLLNPNYKEVYHYLEQIILEEICGLDYGKVQDYHY